MYEKHTENHLKRDLNACSSKILYRFVNVNSLGINIISNSALGERWSKKYAMLDDLFLNYVDLNYISKFVIGKYWKDMNKSQQEKYNRAVLPNSLLIQGCLKSRQE